MPCTSIHSRVISGTSDDKKETPNIIFLLSDDQKWNTIHALGNDEIITPNLDKLAENAMVFNNAYCFGGNCGAVSIVSRNQLITGRNWFDFEQDMVEQKKKDPKFKRHQSFANPEWDNLPKTFKRGGYETYYREKSGIHNLHKIREQFDYYGDINMVQQLKTGRAARTIVDDAIQYVEKDRDKNKPFIMYLGLPCPHDPRYSLKDFYHLYEDKDISLPDNFQPYHYWDIGNFIRDEKLEQWPRTPKAIKKHLHDYYGLITAMDYDLGRFFACLEKQGLFENTIIVFTSDQGIAIGDHGLMGKQSLYEGVLKVPLFITGPGIKKGQSDALVYLHDIFPTLCDLVNISAPENLDGISFKENLLQQTTESKRDRILLAYKNLDRGKMRNQRALRLGDWKLIWYPEIDKFCLYDLKNDPNEIANLAYVKGYEDKVQEMLKELKAELKKQGDLSVLKVDPSICPVFKLPAVPKDTTGGIAPGPNIAESPVENTSGFPYFRKK